MGGTRVQSKKIKLCPSAQHLAVKANLGRGGVGCSVAPRMSDLMHLYQFGVQQSCAVIMKSGNLNFLEPSGLFQACNGNALPLRGLVGFQIRRILSTCHPTNALCDTPFMTYVTCDTFRHKAAAHVCKPTCQHVFCCSL